MTSTDYGTWISTAAAVVAVFYAALGYHKPAEARMSSRKSSETAHPAVKVGALAIIAWCAVAFDFYDRHYLTPRSPMRTIMSYGLTPTGFFAFVDPQSVFSDKESSKLMLITRVDYADIDRYEDKFIEKSVLYTIQNVPTAISISLKPDYKMHISPTSGNEIEYNLVEVPNSVNADSITNLADIERQGGKIISMVKQGLPPLVLGATPPRAIMYLANTANLR